MANLDIELLTASFFGPWVPLAPPQGGSTARGRHHYLSLGHWYESAKFMPARPDLRDAVLLLPTLKEARKFTKAHQSLWRSDWNLIRHSVLIAGLGFLALDRPDLSLRTWPPGKVAADLASLQLPGRFVQACAERFAIWAGGPTIATYGANSAPDAVVGKRLTALVSNRPSWTLASLCNSKTAWRVHDWALSMYVPIRYTGTPTSRLTGQLTKDLVDSCTQLVLFEERGGRRGDAILRYAKAAGKIVTLELYARPAGPTMNLDN